MQCPACKSDKLRPSARWCPFCGARLPKHSDEADSPPARIEVHQEIGAIDSGGKATGVEIHHAAQVIVETGEAAAPPAPGEPPYKGLDLYEVADAALFFGREQLTAELVAAVRESTFLAIVGASGSGKSSLARAGLVAALQGKVAQALPGGIQPPLGARDWRYVSVTPTSQPFEALVRALLGEGEEAKALLDLLPSDRLALRDRMPALAGSGGRLLLLVDQFEELFTLCKDKQEQAAYIDSLLAACGGPTFRVADTRCTVLLTLRADFYAQCGLHEKLRTALQDHQRYIGAMSRDELLRIIELPAQAGHWAFQQGLVEQILDDVGDEPGRLPLLSYALLETWKRRSGRVMTLAGYKAAGGVDTSISRTADRVFDGLVKQGLGDVARRIFLTLVEPSEEGRATCRREQLRDLVPGPDDSPEARTLLALSARGARLVTVDEKTVQISHEALITAWPKLDQWLRTYHDDLHLLNGIRDAAAAWHAAPEAAKEDLLAHRGGRLDDGLALREAREFALGERERKYLAACEALRDAERAQREAQRQHELRQARALAAEAEERRRAEAQRAEEAEARQKAEQARAEEAEARRQAEEVRAIEQAESARRLGRMVIGLAAVLILAVGAMWVAVQQVRVSSAGGMLAQAQTAFSEGEYHLAALRALEANRRMPGTADDLLAGVPYEGPSVGTVIADGSSSVASIAWSPGGLLASSFDDGGIGAWDPGAAQMVFTQTITPVVATQLAWSPSGQLAVARDDGSISIWDVQAARRISLLEMGHGEVGSLAWSSDGHLACGSMRGTIAVWDVETETSRFMSQGHIDRVTSLAWLPNGTLASAALDGRVIIWNAQTGARITELERFGSSVRALSVLPDNVLAVGTDDGLISTWEVSSGVQLAVLQEHRGAVTSLAVSATGLLASGSGDGRVVLWNLVTRQPEAIYHEHSTGSVSTVAWSPAGELASGTSDGHVILWGLATGKPAPTLRGHRAPVETLAWATDGRLASGDRDGTVKVWDAKTESELKSFNVRGQLRLFYDQPKGYGGVRGIAWSNDGHLASGMSDGRVIIWDPETATETVLVGHQDSVEGVAWTDDGRLVSGSEDGHLIVWDLDSQTAAFEYRNAPGMYSTGLTGVVWSPDGKMVAASDRRRGVSLWVPGDRSVVSLPGAPGVLQGVISSQANGLAWAADGTIAAAAKSPLDLYSGCYLDDEVEVICEQCTLDDNYKQVCTRHYPNDVLLWSNPSPAQSAMGLQKGHTEEVTCVAWSQDGRLASGAGDGMVIVWPSQTAASGRLLRFKGHMADVTSVAWSRDLQLASGDADGKVIVWDVQSGAPQRVLGMHFGAVTGLAWSPDGRLTSSSSDGRIIIWNETTDQPDQELQPSPDSVTARISDIDQLAWSPDGHLAAGSTNGALVVWYGPAYEPMEPPRTDIQAEFDSRPIVGLSWSPEGLLAWATGYVASDINLWDPSSGLTSTLRGGFLQIESLGWSATGKLASGLGSGSVALWDTEGGGIERQLSAEYREDYGSLLPYVVAWSPDERLASGGHDGTITIWDEVRGADTIQLSLPSDHVTSLAWSPWGTLTSSHEDTGVVLWDEHEKNPAAFLRGHDGTVNAVAWSSDGSLATAGDDRLVRILPGALARAPCEWLAGNLSQAEWERLHSIDLLSWAGLDLHLIPAYRPTCAGLPVPPDAVDRATLPGKSLWVLFVFGGILVLVLVILAVLVYRRRERSTPGQGAGD